MGLRSATASSMLVRSQGLPKYLGTIDATTTSKTNAQATSAFGNTGTFLKRKMLLIQVSAACSILPVTASNGTVTTGTGVDLAANERVIITLDDDHGYIAAITASGTANVKIWELI
jgi:hypothetical protein